MDIHKAIRTLGTVTAVTGILICLIAGLGRLSGFYYILGFQSMTLFNAGVAFMVLAILIKLEVLVQRSE